MRVLNSYGKRRSLRQHPLLHLDEPVEFQDTFNDNVLDTNRWTSAPLGTDTFAEQNQRAEFNLVSQAGTNYGAINSVRDDYNLRGHMFAVKVVDAVLSGTSVDVGITIEDASGNRVWWGFTSGQNMHAYRRDGGSDTQLFSAPWTTTYQWLRIREQGGIIYWDSAPDGASWFNRASAALGVVTCDITAVHIGFYGGTWQSEADPGHIYIDNVTFKKI